MKRRYLMFALAYCLFLLALCLYPPFGDGRHHFYRWHPSTVPEIEAVVSYVGEDSFPREQWDRLLKISLVSLGIEAILGLLATCAMALLVELGPELKAAALTMHRWGVAGWQWSRAAKKKRREELNAILAERAKAFSADSKNREGVRFIRPGNEDPFLRELANQLNATAAARQEESTREVSLEELLELDPKDVKKIELLPRESDPTK